MTSYSNMSHEKMSDFISFPCLGSFQLKKWEIPISKVTKVTFYDKKMMSDLNMSCQTMSDLV